MRTFPSISEGVAATANTSSAGAGAPNGCSVLSNNAMATAGASSVAMATLVADRLDRLRAGVAVRLEAGFAVRLGVGEAATREVLIMGLSTRDEVEALLYASGMLDRACSACVAAMLRPARGTRCSASARPTSLCCSSTFCAACDRDARQGHGRYELQRTLQLPELNAGSWSGPACRGRQGRSTWGSANRRSIGLLRSNQQARGGIAPGHLQLQHHLPTVVLHHSLASADRLM